MTNSGTEDQVKAALAAFVAGEKTLSELEAGLSAVLQSGSWTPALLADALRNIVPPDRIPPDALRRLCVETGDVTTARTDDSSSNSIVSGAPLDTPDERVAVGQLLAGRYRLERKLGQGGMGVVYLATDEEVKGEIFAIKVLSPEIRDRPEALALLREEVRKTRALAHPNIVGVYSLNVDRANVFTLMEYLEGKTLQALLDEDFGRGMQLDRAWPIIQDIGAALAHAHDRSVIHGDLKPANVFVTTSGRGKLLDFGIARAARGDAREKNAAVVGALTPAYASSEMIEYLPADARDDIYGLAIIIYEMLSGRHPFEGHSAVEARDAGERPLPIHSLTGRQNAALARGLNFDRAARTPTVETLLAGIAAGTAVDSPRALLSKASWIAVPVAVIAGVLFYVAGKSSTSGRPQVGPATASESQGPAASAGTTISDKSIAVLPFEDLSETKDQEYFADGLSQELAGELGKVPNLRVIASTSSLHFKGTNDDLHSVGAQLGAAHVVQGSVRRAGNHIRVTAQLIRTADAAQEWSGAYDRSVDDVLQMQTEIATGAHSSLAGGIRSCPGGLWLRPRSRRRSATLKIGPRIRMGTGTFMSLPHGIFLGLGGGRTRVCGRARDRSTLLARHVRDSGPGYDPRGLWEVRAAL